MSLSFNGVDSHVHIGDVLDFTSGQPMTVMAWVRRSTTGVWHTIISKEDVTPFGWAFHIRETDLVEFGLFDGSSYPTLMSSSTISANQTYHIAGVYDGSAYNIYIDGVLDSSSTPGTTGAASPADLIVGNTDTAGRFFDGRIGDIRIYDKALNSQEIGAIYYGSGRDRVFGNLVGRWLFNEQPPGTASSGGDYSILNYQSNNEAGIVSNSITLSSYTVPSGISSAILVVVGGAENSNFSAVEPTACTFNGSSMTKQVGSQTTATYGAGSAIFTIPVNADDSGDIVLTFGATSGDGGTGRIVQAFVISDCNGIVDDTTSTFNNSGNSTGDITTTVVDQIGICHLFTGDSNESTGVSGTEHTLIGEVTVANSQFGSRVGYWAASSIQTYSGYGFSFASGPNRSALTMLVIGHSSGTSYTVLDDTSNNYNGNLIGVTTFDEGLF